MCTIGKALFHILLKVTYNFKIKIERDSGDILNSHCECPVGRGPHGTCKHLAAVLLMIHYFTCGKGLHIKKDVQKICRLFINPSSHIQVSYFFSK